MLIHMPLVHCCPHWSIYSRQLRRTVRRRANIRAPTNTTKAERMFKPEIRERCTRQSIENTDRKSKTNNTTFIANSAHCVKWETDRSTTRHVHNTAIYTYITTNWSVSDQSELFTCLPCMHACYHTDKRSIGTHDHRVVSNRRYITDMITRRGLFFASTIALPRIMPR